MPFNHSFFLNLHPRICSLILDREGGGGGETERETEEGREGDRERERHQ